MEIGQDLDQNRGLDQGAREPIQHQGRDQGGRNNIYPIGWVDDLQVATSYKQLNEAAREALLYDKGYLSGVRIDNNDGPRLSSRRVAQRTSTLPVRIRETNNLNSELFKTESSRDTNYVHKGWSLSAISEISPWTASRIARNNQVNASQRSITKYIVVQKIRVDFEPEDLSPVPEFEEELNQALDQPTIFEKTKAIYRVFEHWGDVVPLVFDLGVSAAMTDLEQPAQACLPDRSYLGLQTSLLASARASTQGGDPTPFFSEEHVKLWVNRPVPAYQWEQVRVIKAAPITTILNTELQYKLAELHQSLMVYHPPIINAVTSEGTFFDGTPHAFNMVSKIAIHSGKEHIKSIAVKYTTESCPVVYGAQHEANKEFTLITGEHITDIVVWKDSKGICGIQMYTSKGRASPHFGSDGGTPTVMRSQGGCLSAFSGVIQDDRICDIQTIWRHDVPCLRLSGDRVFSEYYGGARGSPFSDWPFVQHSDTSHIANIRVIFRKYDAGVYIDGIQVTYGDSSSGTCGLTRQATCHGGSGGTQGLFPLEPDEHIVKVMGRYDNWITRLCFVTNKGRTSDIFGGDNGQDFTCQAPKTSDGKPTRLHHIYGKSGSWLNGILFVWAPL